MLGDPTLDLAAFAGYAAAFAGYAAFRRARARREPSATVQSAQAALRARWVAEILATGNGILGVQTLRNAIMGSVYFASNTMFLVIGTLTLSAQERLGQAWTLLDRSAASPEPLVQGKLVALLLTLLIAFFFYISAIRMFEHASVSIGLKGAEPGPVVHQIDTAWRYQALGIRCYYFAAPLLFWLFGAAWLLVAGAGSIALMHQFDSAPARAPEA